MTVTALTIPEPLPDDPDAVTTALETAAIFGTQGDAREAVRWVRRAAELAGDEGNDLRALTLARVAADLTTQMGGDSAPPAGGAANDAAPPQLVADSVAATPENAVSSDNGAATPAAALSSAGSDALAGSGSLTHADSPAGSDWSDAESTAGSRPTDFGLAPTVSAQPPVAAAAPPDVTAPAPAVPGAPGWIPPAPPPPVPGDAVRSGASGIGAEPIAAAPAGAAPAFGDAPLGTSESARPVGLPSQPALGGGSQPPAQSLREALQRFSQHVVKPAASSSAQPAAPAPQPDPQQSPALAALVQSIQQASPKAAAPTPAAASPQGTLSTGARSTTGPLPRPQAVAVRATGSPINDARALADTAPNLRSPLAPEPSAQPATAHDEDGADPLSDAVITPRAEMQPDAFPEPIPGNGLAAAPAPFAAPPAPFAPPPAPLAPPPAPPAPLDAGAATAPAAEQPAAVPGKKPLFGARQAVRVSIAATTEDNVFLVELLNDGAAAPPGTHEAFVVLAAPGAGVFDD